MLQAMGERWGVMGRWLLGRMDPGLAVVAMKEGLADNPSLTSHDLIRMLLNIFRSKRVTGTSTGQVSILNEIIRIARTACPGAASLPLVWCVCVCVCARACV